MLKKTIKNFDYVILIVIILLFVIGILALKSASGGAGGNVDDYSKQITWFVIGLIFLFGFSFLDYHFVKKFCLLLYGGSIILLILVLFSPINNGATSWFKIGPMSFQPAEFAKIAIITLFAYLIEMHNERRDLNKVTTIIKLLFILLVPTFLIIKQPDYGTAFVIIVSCIVMLFIGDIDIKYILAGLALIIILAPLVYNFILPEHAKKRIEVFLNPGSDPKGAGYNILQSELAVGSGGLTGQGLYNGNQTQLGMLPMKTTDFIFSVISEEMGFIISASIIILYGILLLRLINISQKSKDEFGKIFAIGVFTIFIAHIFENIGMSMGILPITGIPLPFISYGGSSMLTNMILIGISESIYIRRKQHLF